MRFDDIGRDMDFKSIRFEIKEVSDSGTIQGYGSIFGNVDLGDDIVMPGAFSESLQENSRSGDMPIMLFQHSRDMPCGQWDQMTEDGAGLFCRGKFFLDEDIPEGRKAYALAKRNAFKGLSIGYRVKEFEYRQDGARTVRVLKKLELREVSPVLWPMNPLARITGVKGDDAQFPPKTIREFEKALRDELGFSRSVAKAIASRGFKAATDAQQDAANDVASAEDETVVSDDTGHAPRDEDGDTKKALEALLAEMKSARGKFLR